MTSVYTEGFQFLQETKIMKQKPDDYLNQIDIAQLSKYLSKKIQTYLQHFFCKKPFSFLKLNPSIWETDIPLYC